MHEDDPIVVEFTIESREHLADIENQLLAIEKAGEDMDGELVNTVFRAVHSIKGAAGFLGFSTLGSLAHHLENALNLVRDQELVLDSRNTDVLLRASDTLRAMFDDVHQSNDADISAHVAELQHIVDGVTNGAEAEPAPLETADDAATSPDAAVVAEAELAAVAPITNPTPETPPLPDIATPVGSPESPRERRALTSNADTSAQSDARIRVSVRLLDNLMNLAGELVLSRNQLVQKVSSDRTSGLDAVAARVDLVTSELQEAIMQTRMQRVGTVLGKFPRVVRDLTRQLGKQCELTVEGEEVELDRSIIEAIGDPLTHLIRNSVDHGIESPEQRLASGKPAMGTVVLRAYHQAGKVNISIRDDGAGIDVTKLKEKAVARGIVTLEQAAEMGEREAVRLIFHPGFSMARQVTDVSGRGVGMDVVRTNIEKLGGAVSIETEVGRGTTINVKLPLTLAIVPSLIVRCAGKRFAIPQTSIRELVRIKRKYVAASIERAKDAEVFRLRGELLPLVRLNTALGIGSDGETRLEDAVNIIVVEAGHLQYGLIVDGLHDSEEIVVKPLGRHVQGCQSLTGATILGDGQVALILDVTGIAAHCELALPEEDESGGHDTSSIDLVKETQTSLLFTNHPDEHFGVPMAAIARLERVSSDQIDRVGRLEVLQYRGASLPLLALETCIQAKARTETEKLNIVVFSVLQREVGLIVPRLVDIRQVGVEVDTVTFREPGVSGSVEIEGQAVRLLDLYELTKLAHPSWVPDTAAPTSASASLSAQPAGGPEKPLVLVAEDSNFFRKQLTGFVEEAGYVVVGCEDGLVAWNVLRERGREFALVITDIEMPNLDGCQLAQHIKEEPTLAHLPIIAVTSLVGEEDRQRGLESGIDDYQVKLDREQLMASIARHLRAEPANLGLGVSS
ncbi:MAG: response regulator [bacterium]|nr:response regulator [bacterium]